MSSTGVATGRHYVGGLVTVGLGISRNSKLGRRVWGVGVVRVCQLQITYLASGATPVPRVPTIPPNITEL